MHGKNRLMGNSLLDYNVFGRRAGISAAKVARNSGKPGNLSLKHVKIFTEEVKRINVPEWRKSPILLPDYRGKRVLARKIDLPVMQ